MPVLVEPDRPQATAIVRLLPDGAQVVGDLVQLESWLQGRPDEYVVLLGSAVPLREAAVVAEHLRGTLPSATVVLIRRELTTEVFAEAMTAGIGSVVPADDAAALTTAVARARRTWEAIHGSAPEPGLDGRVVTVFSPKGGVGKTTLAVNLSLVLAGAGKRVCLVDLDLAFGDVAITLQLIPEHTVEAAVDAQATLDFALLQGLLTRHSDNLDILAAPTTPDAKDRVPPPLLRRVLQTVRRHFDMVIVDTPAGLDEPVLQALDETDELLVVATLDVPTIKNVKMAVEALDLLDLLKGHRHLVLNRADDEVGLTAANVESVLTMPVAAAIPTDPAVATGTNSGRPIVLARPEHRVSQALRAFTIAVAWLDPVVPKPRRARFGRHRLGV